MCWLRLDWRYSPELLRPGDQILQIHGACCTSSLLPVLKYSQGRDTANIVLGSEPLLLFGIELGEAHCRFEPRGGLRKYRCHHFTRATPGRPEINQHGDVVFADVTLEVIRRQGDRFANKQGVIAFTTFATRVQFFCGHAINAAAVRTNNVQGFAHGSDMNAEFLIQFAL